MFAAALGWAKKCASALGPKMEARIRAAVRERPHIHKPDAAPRLDLSKRYIAIQVRRPYFSAARIAERLGYQPVLNHEQGMETIRAWFDFCEHFESVERQPTQ
jgi:hypothetical protein